jgi:hypothetical protein
MTLPLTTSMASTISSLFSTAPSTSCIEMFKELQQPGDFASTQTDTQLEGV